MLRTIYATIFTGPAVPTPRPYHPIVRFPRDGTQSQPMKRHVLLYGLIAGILIAALKWTEYRFLVIEHSIEIYGGLVAATFAALGIGLGLKLSRKQERVVTKEVPVPTGEPF